MIRMVYSRETLNPYSYADSPNMYVDGNLDEDGIVKNDIDRIDIEAKAVLTNGGMVLVRETTDLREESHSLEIEIEIQTGGSVRTFNLGAVSSDSQTAPEMVALDDGGFIVVWTGETTTNGETERDIKAQRFEKMEIQ